VRALGAGTTWTPVSRDRPPACAAGARDTGSDQVQPEASTGESSMRRRLCGWANERGPVAGRRCPGPDAEWGGANIGAGFLMLLALAATAGSFCVSGSASARGVKVVDRRKWSVPEAAFRTRVVARKVRRMGLGQRLLAFVGLPLPLVDLGVLLRAASVADALARRGGGLGLRCGLPGRGRGGLWGWGGWLLQIPAYGPTRPSPAADLQLQGQRAASVRTEQAVDDMSRGGPLEATQELGPGPCGAASDSWGASSSLAQSDASSCRR
jgi:hypothetical protein